MTHLPKDPNEDDRHFLCSAFFLADGEGFAGNFSSEK
jgi:hypothetical protein